MSSVAIFAQGRDNSASHIFVPGGIQIPWLAMVSKHGYQYGQLFCHDVDWAVVMPMQKKVDASNALNQMV